MNYKSVLKNVGLILCFILIVSGNVFMQEFSSLDEIWVFNAAKCIANGLVPYRDFNMITTPLFSIICSVFLKIFGNEMIVMRVLESIMTAVILFMIYRILRRLNINKGVSLLSVIRNISFLF
ncbi:MAG: hypothetical protein HFJ54_00925 [Clostridia bacterium]|nr:hypothetical protein [Clostridia bacterium]